MRKSIAISVFLATTLSAITQTFAEPDPNFYIYLAFGQSNMEGQGEISNEDKTPEKRFQMISTVSGCGHQLGAWSDAVPPLANCEGKLGPVDYFGRTMVKNLPESIKVGVAVVAIAGCDIQLFEKDKYTSYNAESYMKGRIEAYGGNPYGRLVEIGKKAQEDGVIKGILLHQGETNTGQQDWPNRVKGVYQNLLTDLGLKAEEVPLLAGEVVQSSQGGQCGSMNSIIQQLPQTIPTAHVISSQGLQQQGDGLHFTPEAYRTFGERYAETMLKLVDTSGASNTNTTGDASSTTNTPTDDTPASNTPTTNTPTDNAPTTNGPTGNWNNNNNNGGFDWNNINYGNPNFATSNAVDNAGAEAARGENCVPIWNQCGGIGYNGSTCCSEGTCKQVTEYFSQCQA